VNYLSLYTDARAIIAQVKTAKTDGKITAAEAKLIGNAVCAMGLDLVGHDAGKPMDLLACLSTIGSNAAAMFAAKKATPAQVLAIVEAALVGVQGLLAPKPA